MKNLLNFFKFFFVLILILVLLFIIFYFSYVIPTTFRLPSNVKTVVFDNITTINDAVSYLKKSGLEGWTLVEAAQKIVTQKMKYSRRNGFDSPEKAFERGFGYCLTQTEALKIILDNFDINSRIVQCVRCKFGPTEIHEYKTESFISGHAWLRVSVDNETKDVAIGSPDNIPGKIDFEILSEVTDYDGILKILGHYSSILVNAYRDNQDLIRQRVEKSKNN